MGAKVKEFGGTSESYVGVLNFSAPRRALGAGSDPLAPP
jgi:hypothetical protein